MQKSKIITGLTLLGCLMLLLTGCSTHSKSNPKKDIQVTTSVNFYQEVARHVLGKHGHVNSIINRADVDPHDFNPSSADAKKMYKANLVIYNGLGYDSWAEKLISSNNDAETINVGKLMGKQTGDNPHIWYNLATMEKLAYQLATKFAKLQPQHAKEFKANAQKYVQKLAPLQAQLNEIKRHRIHKPVAVSEPVFDYSLAQMGYSVADKSFEAATEKDNDPSPASIRKLQNDIKHHRIAFLVVNQQVNSKTITNLTNLAHQVHLPVVKVTETKPDNETSYITWMAHQYQQIINLTKNK